MIFYNKEGIIVDNKAKYERFELNQKNEFKDIEKNITNLTHQLSQDVIANRYIAIVIITHKIKLIDKYYQKNSYYYSLFNKNNEIVLDKTRRIFNEITFLLKQHFSINLMPELSKPESYLDDLRELTSHRMFNLISALEKSCYNLKNLYGPTSKYITTISIIYGDICGFSINNIDFQKILIILKDLKNSEYKITKDLFDQVLEMVDKAGSFYIDAYSISNDKDVLRKSIQALSFLENIYRITNNTEPLPELKRKKETCERLLFG